MGQGGAGVAPVVDIRLQGGYGSPWPTRLSNVVMRGAMRLGCLIPVQAYRASIVPSGADHRYRWTDSPTVHLRVRERNSSIVHHSSFLQSLELPSSIDPATREWIFVSGQHDVLEDPTNPPTDASTQSEPSPEILPPASQQFSGLNWNPTIHTSPPPGRPSTISTSGRISFQPGPASTTPPSPNMPQPPPLSPRAPRPPSTESTLVANPEYLSPSLLLPAPQRGTIKAVTLSAKATRESCGVEQPILTVQETDSSLAGGRQATFSCASCSPVARPAVTSLRKLRRGEGSVSQQGNVDANRAPQDVHLRHLDGTTCMDSASLAERAAHPRTHPVSQPAEKRKKGPLTTRADVPWSACCRVLGVPQMQVRADASQAGEERRREVWVDPVFDVEVVCSPCWEKLKFRHIFHFDGRGMQKEWLGFKSRLRCRAPSDFDQYHGLKCSRFPRLQIGQPGPVEQPGVLTGTTESGIKHFRGSGPRPVRSDMERAPSSAW
ncbi:hypothetical protein BDK51DRAFT_39488 [Blyttiomyces helicus]|uniref:Uncharacterized protein n=1 Tax=Blyttiomyces helicus TaxID=388810 RepID=A0A4V1IR09_9FUNG|nr:hypothetical protein BDK51DRAFT_39488 [Blyttiomyces helicus]|eukprot:RKO88417.1 hypothetical protein BDK51DRAFT_39488 [Blyttiomyces helicus]